MTDHGVPVFQRWFCSAAAALLLHGGAAGLLLARAPSAVPVSVPRAALAWVEVGEPSFVTAPSDGSREGEKHGEDEGAVARRLPTRSATRATTRSSTTRSTRRSSTASSAPASPATAAMRSAQPVAAALSPLRSAQSPAGSSASESLDTRANESGAAASVGAATAGARSADAPTERGASGASAGRGRGLDAGPRLLGRDSPCADLFPYAARSDRGSVEVAIDVAVSGRPVAAQVVDEAPRGQGFALAARHCVRRLHFSPALDVSGKAVASRSVVQLRFERQHETARASL